MPPLLLALCFSFLKCHAAIFPFVKWYCNFFCYCYCYWCLFVENYGFATKSCLNNTENQTDDDQNQVLKMPKSKNNWDKAKWKSLQPMLPIAAMNRNKIPMLILILRLVHHLHLHPPPPHRHHHHHPIIITSMTTKMTMTMRPSSPTIRWNSIR